jgi:hypothetical protein
MGSDLLNQFVQHVVVILSAALGGSALGALVGWFCAFLTRAVTGGRCRTLRLVGAVVPWRSVVACAPLAMPFVPLHLRSGWAGLPAIGGGPSFLPLAAWGLFAGWGLTWGALLDGDCPRPPRTVLASRLRTLLLLLVVFGGFHVSLIGGGGLGESYLRGLRTSKLSELSRSVGLLLLLAGTVDLLGGVIAALLWWVPRSTPIARGAEDDATADGG